MVWGGLGRVSPLVGSRAVGRDALVLDVSDVAVLVVGVVGHDLANIIFLILFLLCLVIAVCQVPVCVRRGGRRGTLR